MGNSKKTDFSPQRPLDKAPPCSVAGCPEPGGYKAPKSRDAINQYEWFCLEHIRERNAKWNYFDGLGEEDIEEFIRDSVTGHRPTWTREGRVHDRYSRLQDALHRFMNFGEKAPAPQPPLSGKLRKALVELEMEYPYTEKELKRQYRQLVKLHHPDVNKGDKASEERFKQITLAYDVLYEQLKSG